MTIWRKFENAQAFNTWHQPAKAELGLPRVGRNAATGEPRADAQQTTEYTVLLHEESNNDPEGPPHNEPALDAIVAEQHRPEVAAVLIRADMLSANEILKLVNAFAAWQADEQVAADDLRSYQGRLYRCVQAHTTQLGWEPPITPALWVDTAPPDVIPEWRQPTGAHDAYAKGDRVTHKGSIWESLVDANVWEPGVFGWDMVD